MAIITKSGNWKTEGGSFVIRSVVSDGEEITHTES